jgi:bifunctional non-homologous end joining protein LigD
MGTTSMAEPTPLCGFRYVMKKHDARRLHYDLRLEFNGVLLSWALPVGPTCFSGVNREAIEMEDHRLENILFEGLHETGPIMLWDRGLWTPEPDSREVQNSLQRGILRFTLHGERLGGTWTLTRKDAVRRGYQSHWILCKEADSFAARPGDPCVLQHWPNSVLRPERSLEEIRSYWAHPAPKLPTQINLF